MKTIVLVFLASVFHAPLVFADTWVESRERVIGQKILAVSDCQVRVISLRPYLVNVFVNTMAEETVEFYQVQVKKEGYFGSKAETVVQGSVAVGKRKTMFTVDMPDNVQCEFWVKNMRLDLELKP